ncbi:MAG: DUF4440 domain-containing protein [Lewinella sp.]|nr:DUF4440 domain-containing protein [Lewinella sp.]
MKQTVFILTITLLSLFSRALAQEAPAFDRGEQAPNVHHTGVVWLNHLSQADEVFDHHVALATFAPGARLDWHIHPGGQQLLITEGVGFYQERGESLQVVHRGDFIQCPPGVEHWHAATADNNFAYVAITASQPTIWLEPVSDVDYTNFNQEAVGLSSNEQVIIDLSREKWLWMAERKVDTLRSLFHEDAVFVHMGGNMTKEMELQVIESGGIHYKQADIHEVSVKVIDDTAILLNRITLLAVVGGNEVTNPFTVTEVYKQQGGSWKLASMSFTRLMTPDH